MLFIFCDYFFAIKLHRRKGRICEIDSEIFLTDVNEKAEIQKLNNERNEGKLSDFFLQTGIIVIGFVKILGIVLLGIFNNLIIYFPFAIIYLIVAYVHIKHTGYWFAYWSTDNAIRKEFKKFADGEYKACEYSSRINLNSKLNLPIVHIPHMIIEENSSDNTYTIS